MAEQNTSSVKTVDRLVRVLDCFTSNRPTWSLAEFSAYLEWPKSTLHRFLTSLESHGILRRDPGDLRWRLGYRLFIWGSLAAESTGLRQITRPMLHELVAATGETALLTAYHEGEVICIDKEETSHHVRVMLEVGMRHPPHAGASSKVLMAYLPQSEIEAIIRDKGLPKLCTNTITDPEALLKELQKIRELGYAESHEETDPDAWGVAMPIYDRDGAVVAAIGLIGPEFRCTDGLARQYVDLCRRAAQRISRALSVGIDS